MHGVSAGGRGFPPSTEQLTCSPVSPCGPDVPGGPAGPAGPGSPGGPLIPGCPSEPCVMQIKMLVLTSVPPENLLDIILCRVI